MAKSDSIPEVMRQHGTTLIELLVGLAVAAILSVIFALTLSFSFNFNLDSAESIQQNDGSRVALTLLARDIASAGFLLSGAQANCDATLGYDSALSGQYMSLFPAWQVAQSLNAAMPMAISGQAGEPQTFDYPSTTSASAGNVSQDLLLTESLSSADFASSGWNSTTKSAGTMAAPSFGTAPFGNWGSSLSAMTNATTIYANFGNATPAVGDTLMVEVPVSDGTNMSTICLRVPVGSVGTAQLNSASTGTPSYMPAKGYATLATKVAALYPSLPAINLSNLQHSTVVDLGAASSGANTGLQVLQYWIDASNGYPVLMRGTYSGLNDTWTGAAAGAQAIAPGAVSLQALFGTVPKSAAAGSTAPTFKTWSNVSIGSDHVVAVAVALVMRTLHGDPGYTAPATITVPQPVPGAVSPNAFVKYTVQPSEKHQHFSVYTQTIWLRNSS